MEDNKDLMQEELVVNNDTDVEVSALGAADDNFDGDADCVEERLESYTEEIEAVLKTAKVPSKKIQLSKTAVGVLSAIVTFVVCVVAVAIAYGVSYNAYNANKDGYMPTLENLASEYGMSVDEVKEAYSLPRNMRSDTIAVVATNYIPAGLYVEMTYGVPFDMAVEAMGLKDDERISVDMRYGDFAKILEEVQIAAPDADINGVEGGDAADEPAPEPTQTPAAE